MRSRRVQRRRTTAKLYGSLDHENSRKVILINPSCPVQLDIFLQTQGDRAWEVDDDDTHTLGQTRTAGDDGVGSPPVRSYSFADAATNASIRMRRLPSVLPPAQTVLSTAFSVGTAQHRKKYRMFARKPTKEVPMPYLSYQPTVGRNSQFVDLTDEQRDELGGIEYRSLKLLGKILWGE